MRDPNNQNIYEMDFLIPQTPFDRSKPFYPIVIQYLIQLVGFKDLVVHHILGQRDIESPLANMVSQGALQPADVEDTRLKLTKLLGPLELASSVQPDRLKIFSDDLGKEIGSYSPDLMEHMRLTAGTMLILAHELCKDQTAHDTGPLWEFLRHCRNAAAHGGKFNFRNGEPRRQAEWRSREIQPNLHGTSLFKDPRSVGFLSFADPILLLWDIEQQYPGLSASI